MSSPTHRTATGYQCGKLHVTGLPPRQSQVLLLRALGNSRPKCAQLLGCSIANIKQATTELFFKLDADNATELVTRAFECGYLRFLSIFAALFIGLFATTTVDNHNFAARISRAPRTQFSRTTARAQRNGTNNKFSPTEFC